MAKSRKVTTLLIVDYLMSDKGHQTIAQVLGMLAENQKSALESQKIAQQATAELDKQKLEIQRKSWTAWMWVQIAVFIVAIFVAATLAWNGKLDAGMGTLIGTLVGYALGQSQTKLTKSQLFAFSRTKDELCPNISTGD